MELMKQPYPVHSQIFGMPGTNVPGLFCSLGGEPQGALVVCTCILVRSMCESCLCKKYVYKVNSWILGSKWFALVLAFEL